MRNRALHEALRNFALEAAALLTDDLRDGAELEFDVVDERTRRGPSLYHYRPRIGEFLAARWPRLRSLPSCPAAAAALGAGAASYLRVNGLPGAQAEPALQAMLERLYEDATSFGFPEERFERVYGEVEETLYEDSLRTVVVAPLRGVALEPPSVDLGGGLSLVRSDAADVPAEARAVESTAFCLFERYVAPDDRAIEAEARERFACLLTGLRLWTAGGTALAPVGWRRAAESRWQPLELEGAESRGEPWTLTDGQAASLRQFLETVDRTARPGAVGWALHRFELGCSRPREVEALSDYLLALRSLLDATGETGAASLPLRVAALCAEEGERRSVQRRVEQGVSLERFLMGGGPADGDELRDWIGSESPPALVDDLERNLRALLRDVVCGYLEPDLGGVADDILLEVPDPPEIRARDLRAGNEADTDEIEALPQGAVREQLMADWRPCGPEDEEELEPDQLEPEEPEPARFEREVQHTLEPELEGVTPSIDWDEDPESYSAPV